MWIDIGNWLLTVKWLALVAWLVFILGSVWTGLFSRYVGQMLVDFVKDPDKKKSEAREKVKILGNLKETLVTAKQYCEQIEGYLSGIPSDFDTLDEKLKKAAFEVGILLVIPKFNLDIESVMRLTSSSQSFLTESSRDKLMVARREMLHLHRQIDQLAGMYYSGVGTLTEFQIRYARGVRGLTNTTIGQIEIAIATVDVELERTPKFGRFNWRTLLIPLLLATFLLLFAWASQVIDGFKIEIGG